MKAAKSVPARIPKPPGPPHSISMLFICLNVRHHYISPPAPLLCIHMAKDSPPVARPAHTTQHLVYTTPAYSCTSPRPTDHPVSHLYSHSIMALHKPLQSVRNTSLLLQPEPTLVPPLLRPSIRTTERASRVSPSAKRREMICQSRRGGCVPLRWIRVCGCHSDGFVGDVGASCGERLAAGEGGAVDGLHFVDCHVAGCCWGWFGGCECFDGGAGRC